MKLTLKERIIISVFCVLTLSVLIVYFSDLLSDKPFSIIRILNPVNWFEQYRSNTILIALVFLVSIVVIVFTAGQSHDHVLQGEDDARLATEQEIKEAFQIMKLK